MNFTRTIISLVILVAFTMCGCGNTAQRKEEPKGESMADKVGKQTEVDRSLGTEGKETKEQSGQVQELSSEEKRIIEINTNNLVKNAQIFIEKKDYNNAFDVVSELQKNLAKLTGHFPPMKKPDTELYMLCLQDPEKAFPELREKGEEGFDAAVEFFNSVIKNLKTAKIKYSEEAIKKRDKAQELRKNGDLKGAFDVLYDAYIILRDSFTPPAGACATKPGVATDKKGKGSEPQQVDKGEGGTKPSEGDTKNAKTTSGSHL